MCWVLGINNNLTPNKLAVWPLLRHCHTTVTNRSVPLSEFLAKFVVPDVSPASIRFRFLTGGRGIIAVVQDKAGRE